MYMLSICILYAPNKVSCAIVLYILSIYLAYISTNKPFNTGILWLYICIYLIYAPYI